MLFSKKPTKERLRQYKRLRIAGMRFVIRKLNPLMDFEADKMPQIFTSFITRRKIDPDRQLTEQELRRQHQEMAIIIEVGLVEPKLDGEMKIGDIMSDQALALQLYTEILVHSLNMFRGL